MSDEKATVQVFHKHIHVRVFSDDGSEVEEYDIQRSTPGESSEPKAMSLSKLQEWMENGCPTK